RLNGATLASFRTGLLTEHRALHVMSDLADAATDAYYEKEGVLFVKRFDTPFPSAATQAFEFWRDWPDRSHQLRQLRHVATYTFPHTIARADCMLPSLPSITSVR